MMSHLTTSLILFAFLLTACGDASPGTGDDPAAPDGVWELVEGTGPDGPIELVDGHVPTLTIDGEEWGGTVCNHYSAEVLLEGAQITVRGIGGTEMACLADGAMASEAAYYAALGSVESHRREGQDLVLDGPAVELRFERVEPDADAALEGTEWRLDAVVEGAGPDGSVSSVLGDPTLLLDDGRLGGETGCNRFGGDYEIDGDRLRVGDIEQTLIGCDEALTRQEAHVLGVLRAEPTWTIDGPTLELSGADGRGLRYRAD
jgi:heat shock protein HslJ